MDAALMSAFLGWNIDIGAIIISTENIDNVTQSEVLGPIVRPYAGAVGEGFVLMHDNARPHTARICTAYLDQQGFEVMDWPSIKVPRP